tara:strand:+ start:43 stop:564 length:522 start_codon:yes stop_codon:yes gene_type:complete
MASLTTAPTPLVGIDFTGVWKEASIDNFDNFLQKMGIGWIKRKLAATLVKKQTHTILYDATAQTIIIRTEGKRYGTETHTLNLGKPTTIPSKTSDGIDTELVLNLRWNEDQTILLNDLAIETGNMHVKRYMVGEQMKVEVIHVESGGTLSRLFDKEKNVNREQVTAILNNAAE